MKEYIKLFAAFLVEDERGAAGNKSAKVKARRLAKEIRRTMRKYRLQVNV